MKYLKRYNEELDYINFSDMKSKWGLDPEHDKEHLIEHFNNIRDRFLELEDSNLLDKYYLGIYISHEIETNSRIKPGQSDITEQMDELYQLIVNHTNSFTGKFENKIMISAAINIPTKKQDNLEGYYVSDNNNLVELVNIQDSIINDGYECHFQFYNPRAGRIPTQIVVLFSI